MTIIWHKAIGRTKEGYLTGMLCARSSFRYAGTGRAAQTDDGEQVTCKRCLAKMAATREAIKMINERVSNG